MRDGLGSALPKLVFVSENVCVANKMSVAALINLFCGRGYDVTLISETLGDHQRDFNMDHRLKRLGMDMGVKNRASRAELMAYFAARCAGGVFILTDFGRADFLEYPAIIRGQSAYNKIIRLPDVPFDFPPELDEISEDMFALWETLVADTAAAPANTPPADIQIKRGSFFRRRIYYREQQRAAKQVYMHMSPEQVRKSQLLASKLLVAFERVCKAHGLRYYIAAGSLLGAVRHGGPIPWDDDVDVTMPRPDYERFIRVAQAELPDDMVFPKNNFPYGFHRMQIRGTEITRLIRQKGPHGVFLDILPLDGAAPTPGRKRLHGLLNRVLLNCMNAKTRPLPLFTLRPSRLYEIAKRLAIKCFAPRRLLFWLWKRLATKYGAESAKEWVCLPGLYGYEKECFPKEYWGEPVLLPYEGRFVPVMREWEKYLVSHYGDYRTPPPVLCRRTHPFLAVDFGKYETMSVDEIEKEVRDFAGST